MQLPLLFPLLLLVTRVTAGGYQGALERVMLYYAYQIDGLKPESERRLGYRCPQWVNGGCAVEYEPYRCNAFDDPKVPRARRCNFWEMMTNLGETRGGNGAAQLLPEGVDVNAKTLPIEKTAVSVYMYAREHMPLPGEDRGRIGDYHSYRFVKGGGTDYGDHLDAIGDVVLNSARDSKGTDEWLFKQFEETVQKIRAAREGDYGRHAADAYIKDSNMRNMHLVTESPGTNPATKQEYKNLDWYENHKGAWTSIQWAETEDKMKKGGVKDAEIKLQNFRDTFEENNQSQLHRTVIGQFEFMERKVAGFCGKKKS